MTGPAVTTPFEFQYCTGRRSMLPRKHLRERAKKPARSFDAAIQPYQTCISVKGKRFPKRKYFVKASGNSCHHNPDELKSVVEKSPYDAESGKIDPLLSQKVQGKKFDQYGNRIRTNAQYKAINKAKQYQTNPDILPSVDIARRAKKRRRCGISKIGKHRSEGREGLCSTLELLFLNMDVHSFRVGRPDLTDKKLFHYVLNENLASGAGLGKKRFDRNIELLVDAKIIGTSRKYEKLKSGKYVGKASAIWFTDDFMKSFGMFNTFDRTSKQLTKRDKDHALRDIKTPEQLKAEATDKLCQAAGAIVSSKRVKRDVKSLYDFIDSDDPPETKH